jgi:Xaa-Pro aminopeptidase
LYQLGRITRNFWYLTGIDEPEIVLVMDKEQEILLVPDRHAVIELFDGKRDFETYSKISGVELVLPDKQGWKDISSCIKRAKKLAMPKPSASYLRFYEFYTNPARAALLRRVKRVNPKVEIENISSQFMKLRIIKQAPEIDALKRAIEITNQTLYDISRLNFTQFSYEYEVEAAIQAGFRMNGAAGVAWLPIVANGANACQIHYESNNASLNRSGLLLLDVGAEVQNYGADISRTYRLNKPSPRQRAVHQAVLEVQEFGIEKLKPGISFRDCDKVIRNFMGEKLRDLGLITHADLESINKYYPHYSHFLGLDAHDVGDYERPFEAGMVVTMEPGIYIPEEGIGVRIEDDILITESGNEVLSGSLPRTLN